MLSFLTRELSARLLLYFQSHRLKQFCSVPSQLCLCQKIKKTMLDSARHQLLSQKALNLNGEQRRTWSHFKNPFLLALTPTKPMSLHVSIESIHSPWNFFRFSHSANWNLCNTLVFLATVEHKVVFLSGVEGKWLFNCFRNEKIRINYSHLYSST